jgi:hypothetical protein
VQYIIVVVIELVRCLSEGFRLFLGGGWGGGCLEWIFLLG